MKCFICRTLRGLQLTPEQFEQIKDRLPRQRGNVSLDNLQVLNAILHVAANGCKWRCLPTAYGNWLTFKGFP